MKWNPFKFFLTVDDTDDDDDEIMDLDEVLDPKNNGHEYLDDLMDKAEAEPSEGILKRIFNFVRGNN